MVVQLKKKLSLPFLSILLGAILLNSALLIPSANAAPYVCNNDICDAGRIAYVNDTKNKVCTLAKAWKKIFDRLNKLKENLAEQKQNYENCVNRNKNRKRKVTCSWYLPKIKALELQIRRLQERIDDFVKRLNDDCNYVPANSPNCYKNEASLYCPINDAASALRSLESRCEDLKGEEEDRKRECKIHKPDPDDIGPFFPDPSPTPDNPGPDPDNVNKYHRGLF